MKKISTVKLAYLAILVAINVVLNIYSIPITGSSTRLSFTYVSCFIAGIFMGPLAGLTVGLLGDVLGCLIAPTGAWLPLITLASALLGLIPGLIFKFLHINPYIKIAIALVLCFVICTAGLNTFGLFLAFAKGKKTFWTYLTLRLPIQAAVLAVNAVLIYALYVPLKKFVFKRVAA